MQYAAIRLIRSLAITSICLWAMFAPGWAVSPDTSPLFGECARGEGRYATGRAIAWLNALEKAETSLPAGIGKRFLEMDLDPARARLALAALAFPVDAVSGRKSPSPFIRVFLVPKKNPGDMINIIPRDPARLFMEMLLIAELRATIEHAADTRSENPDKQMEHMAGALWLALGLNAAQAEDRPEILGQLLSLNPPSPTIMYLLAQARLEGQQPQTALENADAALRLLGGRDFDSLGASPGKFLRARIYYTRALAHMRLNQPALAEVDLTAAADLLRQLATNQDDLAQILATSGQLRETRGDLAGMCADYLEACALGSCGYLATARAAGKCVVQNGH